MRLAYLVSQYPAVNHVFMLREVRGLRDLGFDVRVVSVRRPDRDRTRMTSAEQDEARAVYYVKDAGLFQVAVAHLRTLAARPRAYFRELFRHPLFYFAEAVVVGDWMMRRGLSHVHTHYASSVGLIVKRIFPVTLSATFHGPAEFEDPAAFRLAEKVEASSFCCAISEFGVSQLRNVCGRAEWAKLEVTLLGVDPDEFLPLPAEASKAAFQIICVGRLAPVKGQHVLIQAMEPLAKSGRAVRLRMVGDGPDRASLERDVASRGLTESVAFEGNVNQDRLRELYRESDVLVLSSFAEGLPVVLMEAMAMEIPCVASRINGIPEIITHEIDGLLVRPGDAEALTAAISRLMDYVEFRRTLGQRARVKILEKFNVRRNTEHLANVFQRRLSAGS